MAYTQLANHDGRGGQQQAKKLIYFSLFPNINIHTHLNVDTYHKSITIFPIFSRTVEFTFYSFTCNIPCY